MGKLFLLFRLVRMLGVARFGALAIFLYLWKRR
jgi:hypothetical protein